MNNFTSPHSAVVDADIKWLVDNYSVPWDRLRDKTVVISGAGGLLASYMIETLIYLNNVFSYGTNIVAVVRNSKRFQHRFYRRCGKSELQCVEQDIQNPLPYMGGADFIIHAASQASPKYYATDPVGTLAANTFGTANLLNLARESGAEGFLYFSSAEVYGENAPIPTSEADYGYLDPLAVRSCYAESKRMGENMCVSWFHQYGVPARIVRPFHTYGPGMLLDDGRVYADFVADVIGSRDIVLKGDGLAKRSFCYLADATAGFWMVLLAGENAKAYNIGNPDALISIRDLAQTLVEFYPEKEIKVKFQERASNENYLANSIQITCPDISAAKKLGWVPETTIKAGFMKTIESFKL